MNKSRTIVYDANRAAAIKWTAAKFGCTREYVRAVILGTSKGGRTAEILKAFQDKYAEIQELLS